LGTAEYRKRHKEQGLCIECSHQAVPGRVRCVHCLLADRVRQRKNYYKYHRKHLEKRRKEIKYRIENHLCRSCGAPMLADWDTRECPNCSVRIFKGL
jgi:hypothetical protein